MHHSSPALVPPHFALLLAFGLFIQPAQAGENAVAPSSRVPASKAEPAGPLAGADSASDPTVGRINELLRKGWNENNVSASREATDGEFLRRAYLDLVGAIPPVDAVEAFLRDRDKKKRARLVDTLLEHDGYASNWTTLWSNTLLGRETPREVSRTGLNAWLRSSFSENKPYDRMVYELVASDGHYEQNGAVNFLLANLNDDKTPATAKTARIFLGVQVQCTQCHNHPFNDWKQDQFWQFNSFFQQARRRNHRDEQSGQFLFAELVDDEIEGPVFFERRSGVMQVAYPQFIDGTQVEPGAEVQRRTELAKLMTDPARPYLAQAIVNRTWAHFFGYGFTRPIDDMGPHNPPSHPELLEHVAGAFVSARYDLKQLIRWITSSDAYQLSSRPHPRNKTDDPDSGAAPLFSRVYPRQMTAEQLYESLIVATQAHRVGRDDAEASESQREQWLRQFVVTFGTDENDEASTFNGTIPQALMMMNGELMNRAVSGEAGSFLTNVVNEPTDAREKIRKLYLAALCRAPTRPELNGAVRLYEGSGGNAVAALEDLYWALLNSNEFLINH
jgi:hypothetical protein